MQTKQNEISAYCWYGKGTANTASNPRICGRSISVTFRRRHLGTDLINYLIADRFINANRLWRRLKLIQLTTKCWIRKPKDQGTRESWIRFAGNEAAASRFRIREVNHNIIRRGTDPVSYYIKLFFWWRMRDKFSSRAGYRTRIPRPVSRARLPDLQKSRNNEL